MGSLRQKIIPRSSACELLALCLGRCLDKFVATCHIIVLAYRGSLLLDSGCCCTSWFGCRAPWLRNTCSTSRLIMVILVYETCSWIETKRRTVVLSRESWCMLCASCWIKRTSISFGFLPRPRIVGLSRIYITHIGVTLWVGSSCTVVVVRVALRLKDGFWSYQFMQLIVLLIKVIVVIIWIMWGRSLATCCRRFTVKTSIIVWIQSRSSWSLGIGSIWDWCRIGSGSVAASKRLNAFVCCLSNDIFKWFIQSCTVLRIRRFRMWCRVVLGRGNFCGSCSIIGDWWFRGASLRAHIVFTVHANTSWACRFIRLSYAITLLSCRFLTILMMIWVFRNTWLMVCTVCRRRLLLGPCCWDLLGVQ